MSMGVQISLWDPVLNYFRYIPEVELLDHKVLIFWETSIVFAVEAAPFYFPTNMHVGFNFSASLPTTVIFYFF